MTDDGRKLLHHRTEFDDWRSLTIGIYMALTGYTVMVGLPVISSSWVNNLGFSAVEVGRVAGADLGGLAIGAVISAIYVAKVPKLIVVTWWQVQHCLRLLRTCFVFFTKAMKSHFGSVWRQALAAGFIRVSPWQPLPVIPDPRSLLVSSCSPSPVRRAPHSSCYHSSLLKASIRRSTSHRAQTRARLRAMDGTDSDRPYVYQHRRVLDLY